jgi:hypothetical protein
VSSQFGALAALRSRTTITPSRHRKMGSEPVPNIADSTDTTDPGAVLIDTCSLRSDVDSIPNEILFCLAKSRIEAKRLCLAVTNALTGRARLHRSSADAFSRNVTLRTSKRGKIFKITLTTGVRNQKKPLGDPFAQVLVSLHLSQS